MSITTDTLMLSQIELKYQHLYSGKVDGIWGPLSQQAFNQLKNKKYPPFLYDLITFTELTNRAPMWLKAAWEELKKGIKEKHGLEDHPDIIKYGKAVNLKIDHDEIPWCSAFACWCLETIGKNSTKSAAARSWLNWGVELQMPRPGAITVLSRGANPTQGHVGFFLWESAKDSELFILGGNQSDEVNISKYPTKNVLSYRWLK